MSTAFRCLIAALLLWLLGGPAQAAPDPEPEVWDPIERVNRGTFWFNDKFDVYFFEPVAKVWDFVLPHRVQLCLGNFFANVNAPVNFANDVLQAKPKRAAVEVGRFAVNTTVGLAGFFDPATGWGMPARPEDFGQTLGYWGMPPGPYLVLPILGPSNPRDGVGMVADGFASVPGYFAPLLYFLIARPVEAVNARAQVLDAVRELKAASLDYYLAVRDGYDQRRRSMIRDGAKMSAEEEEELYYEEPDEE